MEINENELDYQFYDDWFEDVIKVKNIMSGNTIFNISNFNIIKCVIPKGSKFYEGYHHFDKYKFDSYASDALTYLKIIA